MTTFLHGDGFRNTRSDKVARTGRTLKSVSWLIRNSVTAKVAFIVTPTFVDAGVLPALEANESSQTDDYIKLYIFLGVVLLIIVGVAFLLVHEHNRSEALKATADSLGLSFERSSNTDIEARFGQFNLFLGGSSNPIMNCISGKLDGAHVMVLEYMDTSWGNQVNSPHTQTVMCFQSERIDLPDFELRPENIIHKMGGLFGFQDIDIGSRSDFSSSCLLRGKNESAIRRVFTDRVLHYFEKNKGIRIKGGRCLTLHVW